ncbi:TIGR01777 family oxidoreductase [Paracrocinitomix mangrovi]|uniref:TIGR01777 family oxidoreductase n=1 Tax=Paracrocinitomix mangrovi TaxID=2862509 RepID=UPI001EDB7BF1|nr:TIGR01777 family oxidoreductase [Paracrocinitomix mangrovi]UKN01042.1 TIGR01777 family oxidoreductase [Paracrocinitomix mangrovi]
MDTNIKHILIAGGTGFLGQALENYFTDKGKEVKILSRSGKAENHIKWDGKQPGDWLAEIEWADVIINLSGKSVDCRYTEKNKKAILASRIDSTKAICKSITMADKPPQLWINASSATTYVHSESQQMTEDEGIIGDDFSMNVCKQWENEFFNCQLDHTRRVAIRTSIVLGNNGGAFPKLKTITRCLMGGKQGNGQQYFSWIEINDFCKAIEFIINHPEIVGPINVTAPNPVRNYYLMQQLRKHLKVPLGIPQPKWLLELGAKIIGTETELLLKSRNVIPEKLTEVGFKFEHEKIDDFL